MDHRVFFMLVQNVTLEFGKPYITDGLFNVLNHTFSDEIMFVSIQLSDTRSLDCIVVIYQESLDFLSSNRNEPGENVDWISHVLNDGDISGSDISPLDHIVTWSGITLRETKVLSEPEKVRPIFNKVNRTIVKEIRFQNIDVLFFICIYSLLINQCEI